MNEAPDYAFPHSAEDESRRLSLFQAIHPDAWHRTFPSGSLSRGRSLLRQIHQLDLVEVGADAEADIIERGSDLAEFYSLSMAAIGPPAVKAGALTPEEATALVERPNEPDFLGCGFVHIGVWGRRATS